MLVSHLAEHDSLSGQGCTESAQVYNKHNKILGYPARTGFLQTAMLTATAVIH